jgi:hypothetical protein
MTTNSRNDAPSRAIGIGTLVGGGYLYLAHGWEWLVAVPVGVLGGGALLYAAVAPFGTGGRACEWMEQRRQARAFRKAVAESRARVNQQAAASVRTVADLAAEPMPELPAPVAEDHPPAPVQAATEPRESFAEVVELPAPTVPPAVALIIAAMRADVVDSIPTTRVLQLAGRPTTPNDCRAFNAELPTEIAPAPLYRALKTSGITRYGTNPRGFTAAQVEPWLDGESLLPTATPMLRLVK